ncbi:hypothetical protein NC651_025406 [Populus alba x Populus x berolinensis]|nr:hypothetical protein NC651_025406 [Populus alba x Populus x berolinensis]
MMVITASTVIRTVNQAPCERGSLFMSCWANIIRGPLYRKAHILKQLVSLTLPNHVSMSQSNVMPVKAPIMSFIVELFGLVLAGGCRLGLLIVSLVGLGLSIVFGCLLLALVAELYYLLWWKRRFANKEIGDDYSSPARELFFMFCLRKPSSLRNNQELCSSVRITDTLVHHDQESQLNINTSKDLLLRPFSDDNMDTELMRLHSLSGPPRFLFTIVEETKEDLESEDGRSRVDNKSAKGSRSRSLSDLLLTVETPYLTPLASPPFFTPPLTPSYNQIGFNHLFESSKDAEFNKIRSSPPPKFKFLQDAEEKLYARRLMQEAEEMVPRKDCFAQDYTKRPTSSNFLKDEDDGPFITIIVDRNKEREFNEQNHQLAHHPSSSSQVLPLVASPSTSKPAAKKSSFFH